MVRFREITRPVQVPRKEHLECVLRTAIEAIEPIALEGGGYHSRVFVIETAAHDYVLRIPKGRQGFYTAYLPDSVCLDNWLDQHWATATARRLSVPAPRIIHADRDRQFVVMERLPGKQIRDYETWHGCPYDEAEFGSILRRLHSVSLKGYGPVDDFGDTYFDAWPDFLTAVAEKVLDTCSRRGSVTAELDALLRDRWLPRLRDLGSPRAALLHLESLGFANILYDPKSRRITGFLDYEDCIGGDPLFELVWMCYYYGDRHSAQSYFDYDRFESEYGQWPDDASAAVLYKPITYLEKLAWIDPHGERAESHNQALRRICGDM